MLYTRVNSDCKIPKFVTGNNEYKRVNSDFMRPTNSVFLTNEYKRVNSDFMRPTFSVL